MRTCRPAADSRDHSISLRERSRIGWPAITAAACLAFAVVFLSLDQPGDGWRGSELSSSPFATAADFTKYALKLQMAGVLSAKPIVQFPRNLATPWKRDIVTTIFWIGELAGPNNPVSNERSSWDFNWTANYGGNDPPEVWNRRNYVPAAFTPRQNPFYVALPYNDVTHGEFKPEAPLVIPWFRRGYTAPGQSVCKDRWIAIRKGNRICYAQWEDCGPFRTDNFQYVFGNERPQPNANGGAGLDVSPAVRDYLGLQGKDVTDWQFVELRDVPQGPWRSYGDNNPFVTATRKIEEQVTREPAASGDRTAKTVRSD
jgi:hypothetical protein